jgi:flagellin
VLPFICGCKDQQSLEGRQKRSETVKVRGIEFSILRRNIVGSFSINTNIASLQAQNYLRVNANFQSQTINEVTSGLRIVSSGDDAAGLAIANGYRSDEAVLTQGIQNANNGLSQLQIMDGGISNISQLLDRARTLATESASGTFTGDRSVLNGEYQSVLTEINRQAQAIGLNQGGTFAKSLSVFIGGGDGTTAAAAIANGSVAVDLSGSTVDTQSLGLQGFTAGYQVASGQPDNGLYDLGSASGTSVSNILAQAATSGSTSFIISGPGFSSGAGGAITVAVNTSNVADTGSLVTAINAGIQAAATAGSAQSKAFGAANISAEIHTGADGAQQLEFVSSDTAFQVTAGDTTANALLGNFVGQTNAGTGQALGITLPLSTAGLEAISTASSFIAGGTQQTTGAVFTNLAYSSSSTVAQNQTLTFVANNGDGSPQTVKVSLSALTAGTTLTAALAIGQINAALQQTDNPALTGIIASANGGASGTGTITFTSNSSTPFTVTIGSEATGGGTAGVTGVAGYNTIIQSALVGTGATSDISTEAGAESAVSALANSVQLLGDSQAVVGRGENQFNYAINLAQSQLVNTTAAESSIRDADLATEAANLTKAQILLQAGVAALAQANSAPQNILSLLKS